MNYIALQSAQPHTPLSASSLPVGPLLGFVSLLTIPAAVCLLELLRARQLNSAHSVSSKSNPYQPNQSASVRSTNGIQDTNSLQSTFSHRHNTQSTDAISCFVQRASINAIATPTPTPNPTSLESVPTYLLYTKILSRLNWDRQTADRLLNQIRTKYPEKPNQWQYEKVLEDLIRDRK